MNRNDIENVIKKVPDLTYFGFGIPDFGDDVMLKEHRAVFAKKQAKLLDSADECTAICGWLADAVMVKSINKSHTSYGWKHIVERAIKDYCSNGAFICAAIYMGFKYERTGPNGFFNIAERSFEVV